MLPQGGFPRSGVSCTTLSALSRVCSVTVDGQERRRDDPLDSAEGPPEEGQTRPGPIWFRLYDTFEKYRLITMYSFERLKIDLRL